MDNLDKLNIILLSNNACDRFYDAYTNDKEFKSWILEILPEIENCDKQQQNNPWHKYNVLRHILHSVEEMNKQTDVMSIDERRILAYAMFLHDIGKPATHITRIKDGEVIDSFFGHNIESEKIAKRVLGKFNFNEDEIKQITTLVNKHDIFMFIRDYNTFNPHHKRLTMKLIQEEIKDLEKRAGNGEALFRKLVLVGRSDNLAQNEKMTVDSLKLLDKIDYMLSINESSH